MAKNLTIKNMSPLVLLVLMLGLHPFAQAESLKDPTLPPANLNSEANSVNADGQLMPTGPMLQSVMLGAQYRAAIIDGQKIVLGQKYGDATLIKLSEREALLRNPDGTTQTLSLSVVDKKITTPVAPKTNTPPVKTKAKQASKSK
jgi:MSHA biogenesis protein MshK